ncbi:MAG: hypothetical protein GY913_17795 [Proteobacteria bacterium]|nr:hypothetical protein [Pseudomonadota bacterium]MCP4918760.1 hypothetical protein [Pseudomonadota bacterium]
MRTWLVPRAGGAVGAALLRVAGLATIGVFGNLMYVLVGRSVGEFVVVHGVLALLHGLFLLVGRRTVRAGATEALGHAVMALNTVGIALAFSYEGSLSAGTIFFVVLHPVFA